MQPEKSAIAEHALNEDHEILFEQAEVLVKANGFYDINRLEAIEIAQHPFNMNRDKGWHLSKAWRSVLVNKQATSN